MSRLPGNLIHTDQALSFTLNGKTLHGFGGDTLASALLANGERVLGRSFKYHRPRGLLGAGVEEPNALLTIGQGPMAVPNERATMIPLYDGLSATTQNAWPSLRYDMGEVNDLMSPFLSAGFYYKTFMAGGPYVWRAWEFFIRRAAGLGAARQDAQPVRYEKINAHCDVLIVGAGPAGLAAALGAGRAGSRVILVDENPHMGGFLVADGLHGLDGQDSFTWAQMALAELANLPNVRLMTRTTAFGLYDSQVVGLSERLVASKQGDLAERYWVVRTKKIILATGAIERPIAFGGNDRPGVMLAGSLLTYLNGYGILPGKKALIFTNNDSAYQAADALAANGAELTLVDPREDAPAAGQGVTVKRGFAIAEARGRLGVKSVRLVELSTGKIHEMPCDVIGMSGGWSPTIHLASHWGSKPVWSAQESAFLAGSPAPGADWQLAGAAGRIRSLVETLKEGTQQGIAAAKALGFKASAQAIKVEGGPETGAAMQRFWSVPAEYLGRVRAFIDFQHDVTTKDVQLAAQEGFLSPEHMKRYTTLGMATDQGKLSNTLGHALLAEAQERPIQEIGTTTYRPPFTPVSLGAFAERNTDEAWMPVRRTPLAAWHEANGAEFIEAADWRRPWFYPRGIENIMYASRREAFNVREQVGLSDVSTLGKIDVQGPDATQLLDLAYCNRMSTLKVGKARYGVMLREDGVILDDGTVSRLGETHFFVTTTTAEAAEVMSHLERLIAIEFSHLKVVFTSMTDCVAAMALAGPKSRMILATLMPAEAVTDEVLPYMGFIEGQIDGCDVRVHRISFSGERGYEIYAKPREAVKVWQALILAGEAYGIQPYGLEALDLLRIEKGFPTGNELDGRTTLDMMAMTGMAKDQKDYIGRVLRKRSAFTAPTVPRLVGLQSVVPDQPLHGGGQLVRESKPWKMHDQLGYVSSAGYSTTLGRYIGLGFLRGGLEAWEGETIYVADPLHGTHFAVKVVPPVHVDPEGERLRG